jgi:hypothetical protein
VATASQPSESPRPMVSFGAGTRELWRRERDYALREDLWSYGGNRIAVRFQYECHDGGQWYRSCGNVGLRPGRVHAAARGQHQRRAIGESKRRIFGPPPQAGGTRASRCADRAAGPNTTDLN